MGRRARGSEGAPPAAPVAPLTHRVRLSARAALDIQHAREWHDAREPGVGDQKLQRVNDTMTRIGQIPTSTRRSLKTFEGPTFASSNTASGIA